MTGQTQKTSPPPGGRREANKRDKLRRIRQAAKEVFLDDGFEDANLRVIAERANVAFGTLFLYASNKSDLLLLVFEDQLPQITERAFESASSEDAFVEQLTTFFGGFFDFFCRTPGLSRVMMRETTFTTGIVSARVWEGTVRAEQQLARIVARAQANGEVSPEIAPNFAAHVLFSLYRIEIRFCLDSDEPDVALSLERLRDQFELVFSGLAAPDQIDDHRRA